MTKTFCTLGEYLDTEPTVEVRSAALNGLHVSHLLETSNAVTVASVAHDMIVVALSGCDHHYQKIGSVVRHRPTRANDVSTMPRGATVSAAWRVSGEAMETLVVELDEALFQTFAPEIVSDRFSRGHLRAETYAQRPELAALSTVLRREVDEGSRRGRLFCDSVIRSIALEVAMGCWSVPVTFPDLGDPSDRRVRRAVDYIEAHYLTDIALAEIASAAGLSVSALTVQFRRSMGMSPYSYVIDRRLRHAESLLRKTMMPIAEVALAAGFADQAHLTRVFRMRRQTTPKRLRYQA
jgi:AraC-like DNA-binding protein